MPQVAAAGIDPSPQDKRRAGRRRAVRGANRPTKSRQVGGQQGGAACAKHRHAAPAPRPQRGFCAGQDMAGFSRSRGLGSHWRLPISRRGALPRGSSPAAFSLAAMAGRAARTSADVPVRGRGSLSQDSRSGRRAVLPPCRRRRREAAPVPRGRLPASPQARDATVQENAIPLHWPSRVPRGARGAGGRGRQPPAARGRIKEGPRRRAGTRIFRAGRQPCGGHARRSRPARAASPNPKARPARDVARTPPARHGPATRSLISRISSAGRRAPTRGA